jgi:glycosyltransferase involved in cell wall biosynthesis
MSTETAAPPDPHLRIGLFDAYLSTLGGGENFLAVFAELIEQDYPQADVEIITYPPYATSIERLAERFGVELRRTRVRPVPIDPRPHLSSFRLLQRYLLERDVSRLSRQYDLFVNNTIYSLAPAASRQSLYMCMFPLDPIPVSLRRPSRRRRLLAPYVALRRALYHRWIGSYGMVLANSDYTRGWVSRMWDLDSRVLYPPVETCPRLHLEAKRKSILSVGRFFAGNHNKKHDVLIDVFLALRARGLTDWELHLVGGRTDDAGTDAYVTDLQCRAAGHPVHFHFDASRQTLEKLLLSSSVFWHATGFGEDETSEPEKLEHFGMSTVEAMTHGCVPLVYKSGGQTEIVDDGVNGFLWVELPELLQRTMSLVRDRPLRERMALAAHRRSQRYGRGAFRREARAVLAELMSRTAPGSVVGRRLVAEETG